MKKFLLSLFAFFIISQTAQALEIIKDTLVRVNPRKPISTQNYTEGDFVYFVNYTDMWQGTEILIPKSTVFAGHINFLKMPVQGVNGAFTMKIDKMLMPNGDVYDINAIITYEGKEQIGGELAPPADYTKAIHYIGQFRALQQWVPAGHYEFGKHTTITQKNDLYIIFKENLILKD